MNEIIKIEDEMKRAVLPFVTDSSWFVTCTKEGTPAVIIDTSYVGNPEDTCWNLIMESGLPVYLTRGSDTVPLSKYVHIKAPKDLVWAYGAGSDKQRLGIVSFNVDDYEVRTFRGVAILMSTYLDAPDEIELLEWQSITVDDGIDMMVNQVCKNVGRVSEEFVKSLMAYYKK